MGLKLAKVKPHETEQEPFFSIVIAMKEDRRGLWRTLDSLMKQTKCAFEVIAVDCASKDRGPQIMRDIEAIDKRFRLIEEPTGYVGVGFNRGFDEAHGEYVLFLRPGVQLMEGDYLLKLQEAVQAAIPTEV